MAGEQQVRGHLGEADGVEVKRELLAFEGANLTSN